MSSIKTKYFMTMIMSIVCLILTFLLNIDASGKVVNVGTTLPAIFACLTAAVYFLFSFLESITDEKQ